MVYQSLEFSVHDFTKYLDILVLYPNPMLLLFEPQEYHDNIGDMEGAEEKERSQAKIQKFISAFD